ncbi:MAG: hypothetical protein ACI865_003388 [Flavobacteriaceae bacterium]
MFNQSNHENPDFDEAFSERIHHPSHRQALSSERAYANNH